MDHLGCTLHNPRFADHLFLFLAGRRTLRRTSRKRNRCRPDRHEGTPSMIWWSTQSAHKVKAEAFCKNTRCCVAIWAGPAHEVMEKCQNFDTLACLADFDIVGDPSGPKTPLEKGADAVFVMVAEPAKALAPEAPWCLSSPCRWMIMALFTMMIGSHVEPQVDIMNKQKDLEENALEERMAGLVTKRFEPIVGEDRYLAFEDETIPSRSVKWMGTSPSASPTSLYAPHFAGGIQQVDSKPVDEFQCEQEVADFEGAEEVFEMDELFQTRWLMKGLRRRWGQRSSKRLKQPQGKRRSNDFLPWVSLKSPAWRTSRTAVSSQQDLFLIGG